jgi:rubredoxin
MTRRCYIPPVLTSFEFFEAEIRCPVCGYSMNREIVTEIPWSGCSNCEYQRKVVNKDYGRRTYNLELPSCK